MPCYTVWSAPISPASIGPDYLSVVQSPGAAQILAVALGVAVSAVLPPDTVVQDVVAPAPRLPETLIKGRYRVQQTSRARRLARGEREERLLALLESGSLAAGERREAQELQRAEEEYDFNLRAAENKRQWAASRLPWPPMFQVMAQSVLEEVRQVDPQARITRPTFRGDTGSAAIVSSTLGSTRIVLESDRAQFTVRVEGEVPPEMDRSMTQALARGFARLKVDARDLAIARLPGASPAEVTQDEVEAVKQTAQNVIGVIPPTYVQVEV